MKPFFKIALGVIALSFAQQASADATIRLTGSTAFRPGVHKGIIALFGGAANVKIASGMTSANGFNTAATQGGYEGADYTTIQGTTFSGISGTVTIQCSWSGSATGIADVDANTNIAFIPAATAAAASGTGYTSAANTTGAVNSATESAAATIAFSDVYVDSTPTPLADLTDHIVAVIPFCWVANKGTTGITNITAQQARAILTKNQPKSLFTGVPTDTDLVLAVGRDNGSGTRITCLAETKYGVSTNVQQYKITTATGVNTIAQLWPVGDGVGSGTGGNGGYASGSSIRTIMAATSNTSALQLKNAAGTNVGTATRNVTLMSSIGISDANTSVTNGATRLSYEGVTYDGGTPDLIYRGAYTNWGYLHLYTKPTVSADEQALVDGLTTQLDDAAVLGTSGLRFSQMKVSRTTDGAIVGP
ncbi:hypothetical protein [Prosthecobacter sp.]|jgi:hypothetical protein|uniref:hypothetical protein n=1 Tax=Prosthecobacter sp. TaxID=1965333 RepID=UPI0037C54AF2